MIKEGAKNAWKCAYVINGWPPLKCEECGKVFSKKGHLDRHVRTIHQGVKDESEPCPHCGKVFTTKSSLEPHIEAVHKGKY